MEEKEPHHGFDERLEVSVWIHTGLHELVEPTLVEFTKRLQIVCCLDMIKEKSTYDARQARVTKGERNLRDKETTHERAE